MHKAARRRVERALCHGSEYLSTFSIEHIVFWNTTLFITREGSLQRQEEEEKGANHLPACSLARSLACCPAEFRPISSWFVTERTKDQLGAGLK